MRKKREVEEAQRQEHACQIAKKLWDSAAAAADDHPYLAQKGVKAHGIKVHEGSLIIPVGIGGKLYSIQTISPKGQKWFLVGGRVKGCYFPLGTRDKAKKDGVVCIAEGFATGASIREATDHVVVVAFNATNLVPVAIAMRELFPGLRLILCADDDINTEGNPGITKATEAARAVDGLMAVPDFGTNRPSGVTDFNDLAIIRGPELVRKAIANATSPGTEGAVARSTPLILDPADPMPTARTFVERFHIISDTRALQHQSGVFFQYQHDTSAYADVDEATMRAKLYGFLETAKRWPEPKGDKPPELIPFKPTKAKVENALDALRAVCNLPAEKVSPCWLEPFDLNPLDIMACRNGLLHLPTRQMLEPTPRFFTLNGIQFAFDRKAAKPTEWLKFLSQLWVNDPKSIETLQEWIGYLLTPRTHLQKILMLVGPKRSGKGTIGRVIRMLLGDRNVCGPALANMSEQFGLSTLIGKSAAIIADARVSGKTDTAVVTERLLSISGEDTLSIPRKYLPDWNGKLPTRFTLMTNELPRIEDSSGALASRFIVLALSETFYGREDHGLLDRFVPELPGILLWALDGWDRLKERGRFLQPESSSDLIQQFEDLGSPIGAFVRERCEVGKAYRIVVDDLFGAWKSWCEENGREHPGTSQAFGRNLRANLPWLCITQPRVDGERIRYYEGIRLKKD